MVVMLSMYNLSASAGNRRIGVDLVNPPFARNVVQLLCLVSSSCVYSTRGSSVVAEQDAIPVFIYPDAKLGGKWFLTRL